MNALNPALAPQREQSMEEILASIRKIIESNEAMANQGVAPLPSRVGGEVVEHAAASPVAHAREQLIEQASLPQTFAALPGATLPGAAVPSAAQERLVSESPEKRVAAAFDDLNLAFLRAKSMPAEANIEAMLKPMLQEWLDNNLPGIVERLVREEIARIARGDI